ncbi:MAG: LON peptidase substrate-binding domain-containing protein [Verrucomicrobium sp.]|nr:LON peptidase substrate-binding domain-containing protein [Verrucomicrobium sp.]
MDIKHDASLTIPGEMPVMVLSDCHLFPGCLLPLYIFEERYRSMLTHALQSHRMFCIGNRADDGESDEINPYTTAGLVRACVQQEDGTSHLLLLGVRRIKLKKWVQEKPFRIAAVENIVTEIPDLDHVLELKDRALTLFKVGKDESASQLCESLAENDNPELVCDVLSYHFTRCPKLQQKLLVEPSLARRFEMLIEALRRKECL